MALTKTQVSQLYVAIFNRASEGNGNAFWQTFDDAATAATEMLATSAAQEYFGDSLDTDQDFIEHIYLNTLNKTIDDDADGIAFWVEQLEGGASRGQVVADLVGVIETYGPDGENYDPDDAATVAAYNQFVNRVEVSNYMADNVDNPPANFAQSTAFDQDLLVTDDPDTLTSAKVAIDVLAEDEDDDDPGVEGEDFYLTADQDLYRDADGGTEGDDSFYADVVQVGGPQVNSLATGDVIEGNGGADSLQAQVTEGLFMGGSNMPIQPRTNSVEEVKLEALNADMAQANSEVYVNAKNMLGVDAMWSWYSDANLIIQNLTTKDDSGMARELSEMTIGMGYTGNADHDWEASDYSVYFDQDYLLPEIKQDQSIIYELMNMDAVAYEFDPFAAVNVDRFEFDLKLGDGDFKTYRLVNTDREGQNDTNAAGETVPYQDYLGDIDDFGEDIGTYQEMVDALNAALEDLIADFPELEAAGLTFELGNVFEADHPRPDTIDGRDPNLDGIEIILSAIGDNELRNKEQGVALNPAAEELFLIPADGDDEILVRNSARLERTELGDANVEQDLRINVVLEKAGLGSDGGELVIGGMSKGGVNEWAGEHQSSSRGIDIFDVTVFGDENKPSSLAGLRSTNNSLREVNIVTDPAQEETYASLAIGNSNPNSDEDGFALKDVQIVDATGMLGDLSIEAGLTTDILAKYATTLGNFSYKLGQADNTLSMDMTDVVLANRVAPTKMTIESYGGDDVIDVDVNAEAAAAHFFDLNIETNGGDDTVVAGYGADTTVSAFMNYTDLKNFSIDTGAGNDAIYSNDDFGAVQVDAGAGDDYIEVGQNDTFAAWEFNTVPGGSGSWGAGNTKFKFFDAKIVLEYQNIQVVQDIETADNYVTTAAEINQAIMDAIDNNWELSQVLTYSNVRNNGLLVTSTIDRAGQDLDIQFLAPKYAEEIAGDDDWTTGNYIGDSAEVFAERATVSESDMASAWSVWYPDSTGIGDGSGTGIYAGVGDEEDVFQAMFEDLDYLGNDGSDLAPFGGLDYSDARQIIDGTNSMKLTENIINAGPGNDVIVLSSNPNGSFDTVVLEEDFGYNVIYNFNTGNNIADFLDVTAYLDVVAATRGASATDPDNARITHQVSFTFNDKYETSGNDFDHNQVVHIDLATLWPELEDATDDAGLPQTLAELSAAQVERALNELFSTDVANATTDEEDMEGSTFVLFVTQDDVIDLQEEGVADLDAALADPNMSKVFTVVIDSWDDDDNEFSFDVTEHGLLEFAEMFSNLSDLNAANFAFTPEGKANVADANSNVTGIEGGGGGEEPGGGDELVEVLIVANQTYDAADDDYQFIFDFDGDDVGAQSIATINGFGAGDKLTISNAPDDSSSLIDVNAEILEDLFYFREGSDLVFLGINMGELPIDLIEALDAAENIDDQLDVLGAPASEGGWGEDWLTLA